MTCRFRAAQVKSILQKLGYTTHATGINNNGWITGGGYINGQEHAYILVPNAVPEPSALAFLAAGLTGGAFLLRKRRR